MNNNLVESVKAEMKESALYRAEDEDSVRAILNDALEKDEREMHDAMFSIIMRNSTKEGLARGVVFWLCERAKEYA